jgi:succinate-semialdehyde dehydrogenase/glutarate-semialdehyde dehydrogenase
MLKLNDPSLLKSQCHVDGVWTGEGVDAVDNPATGAVLAHVPRFGADETTAAVEAASRAFRPWARKAAKERSTILRKWFDLIMANQEDIAQIMTAEQGKPLAEARGEVAYAASFVEFYAEEAKRIYGETIPSPFPNSRIIVQKQPVGVCAAITPWNFPAAMITRKCAPGLAAGCTFVVKPAPDTPLTALALMELALRAGFPAGVLNIVTGDAKAIGEVMTSHPAVRFVGFTGSTPVGKLLMQQAASTVKKVGSSSAATRLSSCSTTPTSTRRSRARSSPSTATWARPASAPTGSSCRTASTTISSRNSQARWRS